MKTCFFGGTVITPSGRSRTDILVENGVITALGSKSSFTLDAGDALIDCTGRLVLPGLIDAHCHIQLDTGIFHTSDDWYAGTCEAARGGITTVIDFVGPNPGEDLRHALDFRLAQAKPSIVDYTFHMTALDASEQTLDGIRACPHWGISSLKIYTTYRPNYYLDDDAAIKILDCAAKSGLTVLVHCENDAIVTHETQRIGNENLWRDYPQMRPGMAETEAAERMIYLAKYTGCRLVIAHNSMAATTEAVHRARLAGQPVFNETCPQYLFLNAEMNNGPEPWRYILQPPLRPASENGRLLANLKNGFVDMLITDHCSYTKAQKLQNPTCTPGGLPGFLTLFSVTAANARMPLEAIVKMLSENPAKIYGLWPKKGAIAPGFDADLLVVDDSPCTIDESQMKIFAGYSPFNGLKARGILKRVFRRGEEILRNGEPTAAAGSGNFIHANAANMEIDN